MPAPSYATLATFRIDLAREAEQRSALEKMIVPGVRQFPGFVSGHWTLDRENSETLVLLTYASRDAAEAMSKNVLGNASNQAAAGLSLLSIRILEIIASA
jgi:quinol monooxygenase YgiN